MLSWIIQISIISIIFIFLVHHLLCFFKTTLTVPKIKDLVNTPSIKYENMYNIIKNKDNDNNAISKNSLINYGNNGLINDTSFSNEDYTLIDLLPKQQENPSMKNELKNFLKKQLNNSNKEDINSFSNF
jgi:hypothetical protein